MGVKRLTKFQKLRKSSLVQKFPYHTFTLALSALNILSPGLMLNAL